jgi:hypothetical protein
MKRHIRQSGRSNERPVNAADEIAFPQRTTRTVGKDEFSLVSEVELNTAELQ